MHLSHFDPTIACLIASEKKRQAEHIELIASENYVSPAILMAQGSCLTNKYAEGYPGKRYYGGCEWVDEVEIVAIERAKRLFKADYANVQPHSGSQANAAAYAALLEPGDTLLGMDLSAGGHLTHGASVNFSGRLYRAVHYGVDSKTHRIDYDEVRSVALREKPKVIVAGFSAYSRMIDWAIFRAIADEVGAYLLVDMAHVAGLVAVDLYPSPIPFADVVTTTTHKTLRGPRGGLILAGSRFDAAQKKLNASIFPGHQGGPLMHVIAAKAVAFEEALQPSFLDYQQQVLKNARQLASTLSEKGYRILSGGTDNHLCLMDVQSAGHTGRVVEGLLGRANITVNKNSIPFDPLPPQEASGIRVGSPAMTTRGCREVEMRQIAEWIHELMQRPIKATEEEVRQAVLDLTSRFPCPATTDGEY